jgi:ABC-2 type transport system permease protein
VGKSLPAFLIGIGEATLIIFCAVVWFRVPLRGHLLTLYTGLALYLISAIGVGLMISSLATTMQQGLLGAFMFLVPAIILSGFTTPIANMPTWIQGLTYLNPMRYFVVIVRSVFLEGTPFGDLVSQFWPMAVIATVNLALAAGLFRHRLY